MCTGIDRTMRLRYSSEHSYTAASHSSPSACAGLSGRKLPHVPRPSPTSCLLGDRALRAPPPAARTDDIPRRLSKRKVVDLFHCDSPYVAARAFPSAAKRA